MIPKKFRTVVLSTLLAIPMLLSAVEPAAEKKQLADQVELSYMQLYDQISEQLEIIPSLQMFGFQIQRSLLSRAAKEKSLQLFLRGLKGPASASFLQTPCPFPQAFREYFRSGAQLMRLGYKDLYQELGARIGTIWNTFGFSERDLSYLSQGLYLTKAPIPLETFLNSLHSLPEKIAKRDSLIADLLSFPPREGWLNSSFEGKELLYLPLEAVSMEKEEKFTLSTPWATSKTYPISKETLTLLFPEVVAWLSVENQEETLQFLLFLPVSSPIASSLPLLLNYWPVAPVKTVAEKPPVVEEDFVVIVEEDSVVEEDPLVIIEEYPFYEEIPQTPELEALLSYLAEETN